MPDPARRAGERARTWTSAGGSGKAADPVAVRRTGSVVVPVWWS